MDLADFGNPVEIAKAIHKQIVVPVFPVPIEAIATALDITDIQDLSVKGFAGALVTTASKTDGLILVQSGDTRRRRFTIGHELGHFLIPSHIPSAQGFQCKSAQMRETIDAKNMTNRSNAHWEGQANAFSAELLMPEAECRKRFRQHREISLEVPDKLSRDFDVSMLAATRRYVFLNDEPCALLSSKDGRVDAIYRPASFPFIFFKIGSEMPRKSISSNINTASAMSSVEPTEPSYWVAKELRNGAEMYEQVLVQESGYKLTLLQIDESGCDDDDD